jgi:hypothetical protein
MTMGDVDNARNGFDPQAILTDWDTGKVSPLPNGRTLRGTSKKRFPYQRVEEKEVR